MITALWDDNSQGRFFKCSLGAKAIPEVQAALLHAQEHPTHDPSVLVHVTTENDRVICWECTDCPAGDHSAHDAGPL